MKCISVPSVFRIMMRYCVAPATPVQPSLTVLPRDSTTLRLDTLPTGCSSALMKNVSEHKETFKHIFLQTYSELGF